MEISSKNTKKKQLTNTWGHSALLEHIQTDRRIETDRQTVGWMDRKTPTNTCAELPFYQKNKTNRLKINTNFSYTTLINYIYMHMHIHTHTYMYMDMYI